MAPTLYHVPKTISSPIVQTLLELDLVPSVVQIEVLSFADLKGTSHLMINPMGTSPAFRDGDTLMWESGAILNYLLEEYDTEYKFYPGPRTAKRAKYLQLQQFIIATVYPFVASMYIHVLRPKEEQDHAYVATAKAQWRNRLAPILINWLGSGPNFLGDQWSVLDFLVAKPLSNINSMGMLDETPQLKALFEAVSARPSFRAAYGDATTRNQPQPSSRSLVLVPN
jgi:glutathione S-transferase